MCSWGSFPLKMLWRATEVTVGKNEKEACTFQEKRSLILMRRRAKKFSNDMPSITISAIFVFPLRMKSLTLLSSTGLRVSTEPDSIAYLASTQAAKAASTFSRFPA